MKAMFPQVRSGKMSTNNWPLGSYCGFIDDFDESSFNDMLEKKAGFMNVEEP
jgi:hypothetical protein